MRNFETLDTASGESAAPPVITIEDLVMRLNTKVAKVSFGKKAPLTKDIGSPQGTNLAPVQEQSPATPDKMISQHKQIAGVS